MSRVFGTIINSIILLCHKTTLHCDNFNVFNRFFGFVTKCFFVSKKMSISKLILFVFLLSSSNEKILYSVMSHNQNHDYYHVKIRFRFFRFLNICEKKLHFMRLLLGGDVHLNPAPFSPIRELDMLIDIVTKNCKNLNICLFNARSLKNKFDFFTEFLTNLTQNAILILTETWLNETDIYPENFLSPIHKFYSKSRSSKTGVIKGVVMPSGFLGTYLQNSGMI